MQPGFTISLTGHALLIAFALFGGLFAGDPMPEPEIADVSVVSEEEYAALTRPETGPAVSDIAPVARPPDAEEATPEAPAPNAAPETGEAPEASAPEAPDAAPETPPELTPDAEVADTPPAPPAAPSSEEAPEAPESTPREAPRVAPEAAPPAPPEAEEAPVVTETTTPEPQPEPEQETVEETQPTAPPEATTEIVTEAEKPKKAPNASPRPLARPSRPKPPVQTAEKEPEKPEEPKPEPKEETEVAEAPKTEAETSSAESDNVQGAVEDALASLKEEESDAAASQTAPEQGEPAGPPLSQGERDALRVSVQQCWNVDVGSEAANSVVTVGFELDHAGRVVNNNVELLSAQGGTETGQRTAFAAARRAVLRCQSQGRDGYNLPEEKFAHWQNVEITFNPEEMRLR